MQYQCTFLTLIDANGGGVALSGTRAFTGQVLALSENHLTSETVVMASTLSDGLPHKHKVCCSKLRSIKAEHAPLSN